jgi:NADH-quinone oxidoreductase subunit B
MTKKEPGVFESELGDLAGKLALTTVEKAVALAQASSIWPDQFGLACCAMEMIAIVGPRYDIARFGAEVFQASPRTADLMIVSGRVSQKMAAPLRQVYDQMLEPKWVIAMGACASSGGMFNNYAVLQGVDRIVPVDVHVPGCPPRPEALVYGILKLRAMVMAKPDQGWRTRYGGRGTEEFVESELAIDPQAANAGNVAGAMGRTGTSA